MSHDPATTPSTPVRVGVVGLDRVGLSVVANLAAAGLTPTVYDATTNATTEPETGAPQVGRAIDLAAVSDIVIVTSDDTEQAKAAILGTEGLLAGDPDERGPLVLVLLTTVALSVVQDLAATCAERGVTLLDAGVTEAGDGKLVTMLGGPIETVEQVRPVLETFSKAVIHCGDSGTGMVTKIARNVVTYASWAVLREAAAIAEAGGVSPAVLLEVMRTATADGTSQMAWLEKQVAGLPVAEGDVDTLNSYAQSDLAAAQEFAGEARLTTPITDVARPAMPRTLKGEFHDLQPEDAWERGIAMAAKVYGPDIAGGMDQAPRSPSLTDTVEHLFAEIWARGNLTIRDRRLLVLGATTMLGRGDLLETQLRGALRNGEFTQAQIQEMALFLTYYTSIENGGTFGAASGKVMAEFDLS